MLNFSAEYITNNAVQISVDSVAKQQKLHSFLTLLDIIWRLFI